jgi:hypothetical protein
MVPMFRDVGLTGVQTDALGFSDLHFVLAVAPAAAGA